MCICNEGYAGDGRIFCNQKCKVDANCHKYATCTTYRGVGSVCVCNQGFTGFGDDCKGK